MNFYERICETLDIDRLDCVWLSLWRENRRLVVIDFMNDQELHSGLCILETSGDEELNILHHYFLEATECGIRYAMEYFQYGISCGLPLHGPIAIDRVEWYFLEHFGLPINYFDIQFCAQ